jgi:asparagine synthase (glutamine-hydrolysing)
LANFVVVVDADAERRSLFIRTIQPRMALVSGLQLGSCSQGDFSCLWAATPGAPISQVSDSEGAAVLWGDAIPGPGPERIDAARLRDDWQGAKEDPPEAYDGFYAGVVEHHQRGVIVGADLLGLFPVYYCAVGGAVLIGSSPELFRHHPEFRMELNPAGLVGILLTNGLVGGETLLKGVQRLSPGHLLVWRAGRSPREVRQYQIPVSTRYFDLPFGAHVEILDEAVKAAIGRHVPGGKRHGLLLSGGLDSRLLGGYLKENGTETIALTLGLPTDIEMQCAIPVARSLGFAHRKLEIPAEAYAPGAQLQSDYEHLANGFNQVRMWSVHAYLRDLAPRIASGFVLDGVIGPYGIYESSPTEPLGTSFEKVFVHHTNLGVRSEILKKLLRPNLFGDLVPETLARLRKTYASAAPSNSQSAWCFLLAHRARYHVGSAVHRTSFGSWPVLPTLDRQIINAAAGIPAASIADRVAEKEMLCRRFPDLAALPLAGTSDATTSLKPRLRHLVWDHILWRLAPSRRALPASTKSKRERRYWYRVNDFNGAAWKSVRLLAESSREQMYSFFEKDVFDSILPPPDVAYLAKDGMVSESGLKLLLASMIWAKNHL